MTKEADKEVAAAMAKLRGDDPDIQALYVTAMAAMTNPPLDATNPHFKSKYTTLAQLVNHARQHLSPYGLTWQWRDYEGVDRVQVGIDLLSENGGRMGFGSFGVPVPEANPQKYKSANTYCRRVTLEGLLGVCGEEDDDANAASQKPKKPAQPPVLLSDSVRKSLEAAAKEGQDNLRAVWSALPAGDRRAVSLTDWWPKLKAGAKPSGTE